MNIRDWVLQRGTDEDIGTLTEGYLKEALALKDADEQMAALSPAVRHMVASVASSLRKTRRGPSFPRAQSTSGSQNRGGQEPPPAGAGNNRWLTWLRNNEHEPYFIPGVGTKPMGEVTAEEWEKRGAWFEQQARGSLTEAARCRNFAGFLRQNNVATARELFG